MNKSVLVLFFSPPVGMINTMTKSNLGKKLLTGTIHYQEKPEQAIKASNETRDHGGEALTGFIVLTFSAPYLHSPGLPTQIKLTVVGGASYASQQSRTCPTDMCVGHTDGYDCSVEILFPRCV